MYKYLLFDLDGTIVDSSLGITNSVLYTLNHFSIKVNDKKELLKFIGPPLVDSFKDFYGFDDNKAHEAVLVYRSHYKQKGVLENTLYEGIDEVFKKLVSKGYILVLATSKPEPFAEKILNHLNLRHLFTFISGSTFDGLRSNKELVIRHVIDSLKIKDKSQAIMIGDRKHDIIGANKVGIDSIGVLYGFGNLQELQDENATYIANSVDDIIKILK